MSVIKGGMDPLKSGIIVGLEKNVRDRRVRINRKWQGTPLFWKFQGF